MSKRSLKRKAAEALGECSDEIGASKQLRCSQCPDDVQPSAKIISKIQAVELLECLVQFMPKEYVAGLAAVSCFGDHAAANQEVADIRILTQFKLRYLCRRFRNIISARTPLTLKFEMGEAESYGLVMCESKSGVHLTAKYKDRHTLAFLPKRTGGKFGITLLDCIGTIELHVHRITAEVTSLALVLQRITAYVSQPCLLLLNINIFDIEALKRMEADFRLSLSTQLSSLKLSKLILNFFPRTPESMFYESQCLKHFLISGRLSLATLDVNVFVLNAAFQGVEGYTAPFATLPEDWSCSSVEELRLHIEPIEKEYDFEDDEKRAALQIIYATLPHVFPDLKEIMMGGIRPQIDFCFLNDFPRLSKLNLFSCNEATEDDWKFGALTKLKWFKLRNSHWHPNAIDPVAPNMEVLECNVTNPFVFTHLCYELNTSENVFQHLRKLILMNAFFHFPSHADCVSLFCALSAVRSLASVKLEVDTSMDLHLNEVWPPPGDLSLVRALPKTLKSASFVFSLRPNGVVRRRVSRKWTLRCNFEVPDAAEVVYKTWLRNLLFAVNELTDLDRFYARCFAPWSRVLVALGRKWSQCSTEALADFGLMFVVHIQCAPLYTRLHDADIPAEGDIYRFRFVTASSAKKGDGKVTVSRKNITIDFYCC